MNDLVVGATGFAVAASLGAAFWLRERRTGRETLTREASRVEDALGQARRDAEQIRREAEVHVREQQSALRSKLEAETQGQRRESQELEKRLGGLEVELERRAGRLETREGDFGRKETDIEVRSVRLIEKETLVEQGRNEIALRLERMSEMTREEARRALVEEITAEARIEAARRVRLVEEDAKNEADRRAKKFIALAIERLAGEWVAERTVSIVALPADEIKGRLIGREGRNIRAIEAATGVDLIIDDTPETVVISCHNPVRREIARMAVEKLVSDGRIHPARIEEVVRKAEKDVQERVHDFGQKALLEVGVHGVHVEITKLLGMLHYRYSYGQNVLVHSIEAAFIAGTMAAELGLNEKQARRAALLHDIGKALTHEVEGSHALIGAEVARRYGENSKICNAIAAHHEEVPAETLLAPLVDAADALSGARPGARREVLDSYVKRLEDLERLALEFEGVERCFAVQAGREIRVVVEPKRVDDDRAATIARELARRIENELTYPGQVRVTVIRETRASDVAR